jgi:glycine/D-amino acid oxidase-like deaminating enzyme
VDDTISGTHRADRVAAVRVGSDVVHADDVVIAAGIWGPAVARLAGLELPLVPVAHPYVYSPRRSAVHQSSPLVRWPEHGVYTRDHGDRDGLGTSGHEPLVVPKPPPERADLSWPGGALETAIIAGTSLWPAEHRWQPMERVAGLLSITPDNRPLLGPLRQIEGLWAAESIWVTHAGGAARALVAAMFGEPESIAALAPDRFADEPPAKLWAMAAAQYGSDAAPVGPSRGRRYRERDRRHRSN